MKMVLYSIIIFILMVAVFAFVIRQLAKLASRKLDRVIAADKAKQAEKDNIFIKAHRQMLKEQEEHKAYLEWLEKKMSREFHLSLQESIVPKPPKSSPPVARA